MNDIVSDNIAKMVRLYSYNPGSAHKNNSSVVEYHAVGADGKTYGILKEGTKYYIKVAPVKDTKIVAEDYDYIGGITNKKKYEYDSYSKASKQFDLKMMSINEANRSTCQIVETNEPSHSEWQVKETKEMRAEIDRYMNIVENTDRIITEGTNAKRPKAVGIGSATGAKAKKGDAFTKRASTKMNQNTGKCKSAKCADDTFDETPMTTDRVNRMGERADYRTADKTYSKKGKKVNEQTALCSRENPDYMDMSNCTEKGSTAPYKTKPTVKMEKCCYGTVCEEEAFNDDNMYNPKPGTGCAKCKSNPWSEEVNEETILPDEVEGFEMETDETIPYGDEDGEMPVEDYEIETFDDEFEDDTETDDEEEIDLSDDDMEGDDEIDIEVVGDDDNNDEIDVEIVDDDDFEDEPMADECSINESEINYFGKHPAYGKQAFTTPEDTEIDRWGRDWNDASAKGGRYGKSKGKSSPYDDELLIDSIVNGILKKKR